MLTCLQANQLQLLWFQGLKLSATTSTQVADPISYRRLVGRLVYLTNTRPDIYYVVHKLSRILSTPMDTHVNDALHILRYIKGSPDKGLFFSSNSDGLLKAFSDVDWAACLDSRRSIIGFSSFCGSSLISWKSKKQSIVSRSSFEAKHQALALTTFEIQ